MNYSLLLNDDLQKTVSRYNKLKKGRRPEPFISSNQNEEVDEPVVEKPKKKVKNQ
jgi:hypothetical protein